MERVILTPRQDWQRTVEEAGLTFHSPADMAPETYWNEAAAYRFTAAEVDRLELAANTLQEMCLAAAQHVIDHKRYAELAIPPAAIPLIEWAWNQEPPALYGRFDIAWAGEQSGHPPKLLEYNADTPTSLLEAAVIQWTWLEDLQTHLPGAGFFHKADQFNSLHERLIAKWKDVTPYLTQPVYFTSLVPDGDGSPLDTAEDFLTTTYLEDTAQQAGLATRRIALQQIGWNAGRRAFVDTDVHETQIHSLFKLYPWESLLTEAFAPHLLETYRQMTWIEPIWKTLLSNKGILPILWELYPNHELLLPAYFEPESEEGRAASNTEPSGWIDSHRISTALAGNPSDLRSYVLKPLHSREGANITVVRDGRVELQTPGPYTGPRIRQELAPPAVFRGSAGEPRFPVLGLWMIDQECGGMSIRESRTPVTGNLSSFVPHYFL